MNDKTYSNKSNALRAAKREGLARYEAKKRDDGRWELVVQRPVAWVWDYLERVYGDVPFSAFRRKDAVKALVDRGVNPNTAKTQFQRWRKARLDSEGTDGEGAEE